MKISTRSLSALLLFMPGCAGEAPNAFEDGQRLAIADQIEIDLPAGWYDSPSPHSFDLNWVCDEPVMTTGVFAYASSELGDMSPDDAFDFHVDETLSERANSGILREREESQRDGLRFATIVCEADGVNSVKTYYRVTMVEFPNQPLLVAIVVQATNPTAWTESEPILRRITESIRRME